MDKVKRGLVLVLLVAVCPLLAQEAEDGSDVLRLTIADAVDYAVQGNLTLKEEEITLKAKERATKYSWNSLSPSVTASASLSQRLIESNSPATVSIGGTISVALTPSIYTNIQAASLAYSQQELSYESAKNTIELNVRTAFYSLLYEQENIRLLQNSMENAERQYNTNLAKYNRGTLAYLDVLSAQVTFQNAQLSYQSAGATFANDIASFKHTLGLPQETEVTLDGALSDILDIGDISVDDVEEQSATIAGLKQQLEAARNSLLATKFSAWGPTLSASYTYSWAGDVQSGLSASKGSGKAGTISLGASIPLDGFLPWSSGAQSIASKQDDIDSLELQLEDARQSLEVTVQTYLNQIRQTQDTISLRQSSINLAQRTYDMTVTAYNNGMQDLLSLQTAYNSLLQARVSLMSDAYSLVSTILQLENALGVPFGTLSAPSAGDDAEAAAESETE